MTVQERWDIVLKPLHGPLSRIGEQVLRGPVVRMGANPGPGGFQLKGYRGLDARQCVISAYSGGSASVAPVGSNQVRLAPHSNVNWREIDPITGPEYLTKGNIIHLGPVGRGATIEFVECRRLGVWQKGRLASEAADVESAEEGALARARRTSNRPIPAAYDAKKVGIGRVAASTAPFWFLGCTSLMAGVTTLSIVLVGLGAYMRRDVANLGPVEEGVESYESIDITEAKLDDSLLEGLQKPFYDFVMSPNSEAARSAQKGLDEPENWDEQFFRFTTASVEKHVQSWSFFSRLDAVSREYSKVVEIIRANDLPEVFAAIPYTESRYTSDITSPVCAKGWWQFMPETAHRVGRQAGVPFQVLNCRFKGRNVKWTPEDIAPPPAVKQRGAYMDEGACLITRCDVDDRLDLSRSTAAAVFTLNEAWEDPLLRASGSLVQITISSHNAGYDDGRFGRKYAKKSNLKHAYGEWNRKMGSDQGPYFYGQNIRCARHDSSGRCGSLLPAETQHYAYNIVAVHMLAVCYYARNYGEDRAFNPWRPYVSGDGYCDQFKIPSKAEVQQRRRGRKKEP